MTEKQILLIQNKDIQKINHIIFRRKNDDYHKLISADFSHHKKLANNSIINNYFNQNHNFIK